MRIGLVYDLVYPYTLGGVEHRNYQLARRLLARDAVTIYGFDYWARRAEGMLPGCRYVSVGAARDVHAADGKRKVKDAIAAAWGTLRALSRSEDDVWDVANIAYLPVLAASMVARLRRRALVVTWFEFFGEHWAGYLGRPLGWLARLVERLALAASPLAIVGSPLTRDRLLTAGFPAERLRYVPLGVDVDAIDEVRPAPLPGASFVCAGRLTPHKRVDLAIRALALLRERHPDATLWVIGDGLERGRLQSLADDLRLSTAVRFFGFVEDERAVLAALKACRVAVLPSAREGFGLTAVQAWACGLPAVVCDDPENATRSLLVDERLGRVVPPTDESIAGAMAELLTTGDAGRAWRAEHARAHYDLGPTTVAVRGVYAEAQRRAGRGGG